MNIINEKVKVLIEQYLKQNRDNTKITTFQTSFMEFFNNQNHELLID